MAENRIDFTVGAKVDQNSFNQVKKAFDELNRQMATKSLDKNSLISKETIKSAEQFQDIILIGCFYTPNSTSALMLMNIYHIKIFFKNFFTPIYKYF